MGLSSHEMNLLFRDSDKLKSLETLISTPSPIMVCHSKPLIEGMRKMVKGGHIIDLVYCGKKDQKDNKDLREEMISIRRLKFILSQLYHSLIELEGVNKMYNANEESPKLTDPVTQSSLDLAFNSGRKRYFEYALNQLSEKDQAEFSKERSQRLKKLTNHKVLYSKESIKG